MTIRQTVCYTLFWSKVLLSLSACTLAWGYIIEKAFTLHKIAQFTSKWTPRYIPHIGDCTAETNIGMARLEPPDGFMYVGFHIDWKINGDGTMPRDTVPLFGGRKASIFNAFYTMNAANENSFDKKTMMWHAHATAEQGALMEITMEPVNSYSNSYSRTLLYPLYTTLSNVHYFISNLKVVDPNTISDAILIDFADTLADINLKLGVPVLLRWGHEMNGDWTTYGGRPLAFKSRYYYLKCIIFILS